MALLQHTGSQQGGRHAGNNKEGGDLAGDRGTAGYGFQRTAG
jgi:hypothetical protein